MTLSLEMKEYLDFMGWLEKNYPSIHSKYWDNIDIPIIRTITHPVNQLGDIENYELLTHLIKGFLVNIN